MTTSDFPAAYFETRFRVDAAAGRTKWPECFAILTAWATTGEIWSLDRNQQADERLRAELVRCGAWHVRCTGYSPATGHAEPGWAVDMDCGAACELGRRFLQHAFYYVRSDELRVVSCRDGQASHPIDRFTARIDEHPVTETDSE
jgi:hypothetical protein